MVGDWPIKFLVVHQTVVGPIRQPPERDRRAIHVREESLEPLSVVGFYFPLEVCLETTVRPGPHTARDLARDLPFLDHEVEDALAEVVLEPGEVEVLHGVEASI